MCRGKCGSSSASEQPSQNKFPYPHFDARRKGGMEQQNDGKRNGGERMDGRMFLIRTHLSMLIRYSDKVPILH